MKTPIVKIVAGSGIRLAVLSILFLGMAAACMAQAVAPTPPMAVPGPGIVVDRCSLYSSAYEKFANGAWWNDLGAEFGMVYCTTITFPAQPVTVTRGNWDIQIPVTYLGDYETGWSLTGPTQYYPFGKTHTTVSVTATATSIGANPIQSGQPSNASPNANCSFSAIVTTLEPDPTPISSTGTIALYDVNAPDAPSGALATGQQDSGNGASGILHIPLAPDWARSQVTFSITVTQSLPNTNAPEQPGLEAAPCNSEICQLTQSWSNTSDFNSVSTPNFAQVNNCTTNCACPTPENSIVYIEPAALLQLNVLPVTIVYSPVGSKAKSSFALDAQTGTNVQFSQSSQTVNATTADDKEALSGGLTIVGFSVSGSGTWDNSVLNSQSNTSAQNVSIVDTTDIGYTSTVPWPSTWPALDSVTYATQPFWNDLFLIAVNPQLAAWDYPSGAIVEPLGSAALVGAYVQQLDKCRTQKDGVLTYFSSPIAGTTTNNQIGLANSDCLALLQLDPFWVADTQNAVPPAYRTMLQAGISGGEDEVVNENTSATLAVTQTQTDAYTTTVTSIQTNKLDDSFSENYEQLIGVKGGLSTTTSNTNATTLTATSVTQSGATLKNSVTTSNEVSDPQNTKSFGAVFYQDAYLGGIAIQDQGMSFPHCRLNPLLCAQLQPVTLCPVCARLPQNWQKTILYHPVVLDFNRHIARPLRHVAPMEATYKPLRDVLPLFSKSAMGANSLSTLQTVATKTADLSKARINVEHPPPPPQRTQPKAPPPK
jgi:hypothetical protein